MKNKSGKDWLKRFLMGIFLCAFLTQILFNFFFRCLKSGLFYLKLKLVDSPYHIRISKRKFLHQFKIYQQEVRVLRPWGLPKEESVTSAHMIHLVTKNNTHTHDQNILELQRIRLNHQIFFFRYIIY